MKKLLLSFFLLLSFSITEAQNLIPNPSFETISSCPTAQSQLSNAIGWSKPPGSGTTPDLFHSCHPGGGSSCTDVDLPGAFVGNVTANTGDGAGGVLTRYDFCGNCREYIQIQLSTPLVGGTTYDVEYYALCPPNNKYETNGLDCYIGGQISQPGNQPITAFTPQISSPLITKAMGWTLVSGTYTAAGGEQYITIGNYRNDAGTTFNTVTPGGSCALTNRGATYLVDDVSVTEQTLLDGNLLSFHVSKWQDRQGLLEWELTNPQDFLTVSVQRSADAVSFETIAKDLSVDDLEYIDLLPQWGDNYYRLRFEKVDGTIAVTPTRVLTFEGDIPFAYSVYPNPFRDILQVETFNESEATELAVSVLDITGRLVFHKQYWIENGRGVITIDELSHLASGTYIVKLAANNIVQQRKLIKR